MALGLNGSSPVDITFEMQTIFFMPDEFSLIIIEV